MKRPVGQTGMSAYERQIQQNIEERKKIFEMLELGNAKSKLADVLVKSASKENKVHASSRGFKRKKEEVIPVSPLRMSLRTRKQPGDEQHVFLDLGGKDETVRSVRTRSKSGPMTLSSAYADQDALEDSEQFLAQVVPLLEKKEELDALPKDQRDFLKLISGLSVTPEGVAKVVKSRIYSLAWHPNTSKMLLAAGDRDGNIGFWDVDAVEDKHNGVRAYDVHSAPINALSFDRFNPTRLFSTSYDGRVRQLDFNSNVFEEVYSIKVTRDTWTAYHVQKDPSTLLVSQSNGELVVVDMRTVPGKVAKQFQLFENSVRTLSLHPTDDNLFMACNRYGETGIFDIRHDTRKGVAKPVTTFPKCSKGVHGAFFSPITGRYALTTSMDHMLRIWDLQDSVSEAKCHTEIEHNNFTGRWLTPFKAVWHPQREDAFVVGSMEHPRRIELYGAPDGKLLHNFKGDSLASVCSINAFHPTVPILAGGNSSGRVHVFRAQ